MLSTNNKIQSHVAALRGNLSSNPAILKHLLFNIVLVLLYCLSNVYLGLRGWQAFGSYLNLPLYILALAGLSLVLPVVSYLLDQGREARIPVKVVAYAGFYWTAFLIYTVFSLAGTELFQLANLISGQTLFRLLPAWLGNYHQLALWLAVGVSLFLLGLGTWLARQPRITGYLLKTDKPMARTRPLRIALLSDIHYGSLVSTANLDKMCRRVHAQHPDLILLAGDLIDNSLDMIRQTDFIAHMSRLQAPLGVFAVLGNHELINADEQETLNFYRAAGIRVLLDETVDIDGQLILAGRRERSTEYSGPLDQLSPDDLLAKIDRQKPVIVLQHQPADLYDIAATGADLALAGHTHGGQLFPLNILNRRHFDQTAPFRRIDGMMSIISDGYGTWGPPIRVGSRSEIVLIDLSAK